MSNIGKYQIILPPTLTINKFNFNFDFYTLEFIGKLGTLSINLPNYIIVNINKDSLSIESDNKVMWGTIRNLINQAIIGVTTGYSKKLELIGIGFKVSLINNNLIFNLGKSHPVVIPLNPLINVKLINSSTLIASSLSNSLLSTYLHSIRLIKPASKDHYKGKGIKVTSELL